MVLCLDSLACRVSGADSMKSGPLSASGVGLTGGREEALHSRIQCGSHTARTQRTATVLCLLSIMS